MIVVVALEPSFSSFLVRCSMQRLAFGTLSQGNGNCYHVLFGDSAP